MVTIEQIKQLREETGSAPTQIKKALEESKGDMDKARELLRVWGKNVSIKKVAREAKAGLIETYLHPNAKTGVLLDIRCETDFVAKSPEFKKLAHEVCLQIAAMKPFYVKEEDIPEEKRKDFYTYVDEFQSFATSSFADVLSEARKYHLNLILANQYLNQIDEKVRDAIFGNVGTIISFKVGLEDAKFLAEEFYPVFNQEDIINLPCYGIYLKLMIGGKTSTPFSADSLPPIS